MKVTVAICTWNRADLLDQTLEAMGAVKIPNGVSWEILVVDNNSTDATPSVVSKHAGRLPVRYLFEGKQGQSNARNRAIEEADGDLIIWTDDDVIADPGWVAAYADAAREWPEASFFGGTIEPWFPVEPPDWIRRNMDAFGSLYVVNIKDDQVRPLGDDEPIYGANMAFRLAAQKAYPYDPSLGHVGNVPIGNDETNLIGRMRRDGHKAVWVGTARVKHYIIPKRMNTHYIWRRYMLSALGDCRWNGVPAHWSGRTDKFLGVPLHLAHVFLRVLWQQLSHSRSKDREWANALLGSAVLWAFIREMNASWFRERLSPGRTP